VDPDIAQLVVHMAKEHPGWGDNRIGGALANLGDTLPRDLFSTHSWCSVSVLGYSLVPMWCQPGAKLP
jgi:hypothetical protein